MINIPESNVVWAVCSEDYTDEFAYGIGLDKVSALAAFMALYRVDLTHAQVVAFMEEGWVHIPALSPYAFALQKIYYEEGDNTDG